MTYKALPNAEKDKWSIQAQGKIAAKVGIYRNDSVYGVVSGIPEGYLDDRNFEESKMLWENVLRENPGQTSMKLKKLGNLL